MEHENRTIPSLSLLIVICDRGKGGKAAEALQGRKTLFNLLTLGKGTANSKILNYLGLGQTEKTILFSVMSYIDARDVLSQLEWALDLKRPGHGIAFTAPLSGACVKEAVKVLAGADKRGGEYSMEQQFDYELILAVANRGYNQEVMDAARAGKAAGGTIINAKGFALSGAEKFFGISLQPEKEIIVILTPSERKAGIMKAIAEKAGPQTLAGAVTISLPVSDVEGLPGPDALKQMVGAE
ncbi:MAG: hypothetical protein LBO82_09565 [Synergistaceae bacterium]|jgi:hypothetical protein|nr:hypothetical protein [Synergistaceae bacterium]